MLSHKVTESPSHCVWSPLLRQLPHVLPVLLDPASELGGALAREGAGIRDRASLAHVVAQEILTIGVGLHVVDVDLLHAKVAVAVATVVRFVSLGHLAPQVRGGRASITTHEAR